MVLRAQTARVINEVVSKGKTLDASLGRHLAAFNGADRALGVEISYGGVRWHGFLLALIEKMTGKPASSLDPQLRCLLVAGLYQLWKTRVPDHAAVSETVSAVQLTRAPKLRGLVNALLRRFLRERDSLLAAITEPQARFSHPGWLLNALEADWPAEWQAIAAANNQRAPMWLRVNRLRVTPEDYRLRLHDSFGPDCVEIDESVPDGLRLTQPVSIDRLPGFAEGDVSVQDGAAQLAAEFLDARPGERVLDACAAPGGKTAHVLERAGGQLEMTAIDSDLERLRQVDETLARLALSATTIAADAANPDSWWDGKPFDRILLDAPCSASGVIRRHPDIKFTRRASDIQALAGKQRQLLSSLWTLLAPGGRLLYATCSVLDAENGAIVNEFLGAHSNGRDQSQLLKDNKQALMVSRPAGLQVLPGTQNMDGFFYACIVKQQ